MLKLQLTEHAAGAVWQTLIRTQVKGRTHARLHSHIMLAIRASCATPLKDNPDELGFKDGVIEISEEDMKYLASSVDAAFKAGVPGNQGQGYGELVEVMEAVEATK